MITVPCKFSQKDYHAMWKDTNTLVITQNHQQSSKTNPKFRHNSYSGYPNPLKARIHILIL